MARASYVCEPAGGKTLKRYGRPDASDLRDWSLSRISETGQSFKTSMAAFTPRSGEGMLCWGKAAGTVGAMAWRAGATGGRRECRWEVSTSSRVAVFGKGNDVGLVWSIRLTSEGYQTSERFPGAYRLGVNEGATLSLYSARRFRVLWKYGLFCWFVRVALSRTDLQPSNLPRHGGRRPAPDLGAGLLPIRGAGLLPIQEQASSQFKEQASTQFKEQASSSNWEEPGSSNAIGDIDGARAILS